MDDLIDSMARRHLAYRRLDVGKKTFEWSFFLHQRFRFQAAIDHQRRSGSVRSSLIGNTRFPSTVD